MSTRGSLSSTGSLVKWGWLTASVFTKATFLSPNAITSTADRRLGRSEARTASGFVPACSDGEGATPVTGSLADPVSATVQRLAAVLRSSEVSGQRTDNLTEGVKRARLTTSTVVVIPS